ncbi:MAG: replication initiation factor domain-containing protein, partial [Actinobacteria bacterium]|nr:replication initiation factor domain-containing protein [Actinomycetota bacterium]
MTVKCDWLDVTYAPDNTPEHAVLQVIQAAEAESLPCDGSDSIWRLNYGILKIEYRRNHARISASGAFLDGLRQAHAYMDYLSALSEAPHAVTRLDAAHDVPVDSPPILRALIKRYPRECTFTRKALRTKRIMETRSDGLESGTWYAGHRQKGMVTARVYDKRLEREARGDTLPAPLTRYELTFRKGIKSTLRDAAEPDRIFWQYAGPLLLRKPKDVPEWSSGWGGGWAYKRDEPPL